MAKKSIGGLDASGLKMYVFVKNPNKTQGQNFSSCSELTIRHMLFQ